MGFLSVIIAAIAAFAAGAAYYMVLGKPWMAASGVPLDEDGQPINSSKPLPYIVSFLMILLVAGMMRHTFVLSGIDTLGKGLTSGLGIGAFFIAPWMFLNAGYEARPWALPIINGGYAILSGGIIGVVLTLF